jgi:hypothetical protein
MLYPAALHTRQKFITIPALAVMRPYLGAPSDREQQFRLIPSSLRSD